MKKQILFFILLAIAFSITFTACEDNETPTPMAKDPDTATKASIDRFSSDAGHLMVRNGSNGLPEANESINFDSGEPFITMGLGPDGELVQYYNFDVQPTAPAPIYAFFHENGSPVNDQLNIINVIPGDVGYNDFWEVVKVTVPDDYVANSITNFTDLNSSGYSMEETTTIVNCPVVPEGSTASKRLNGGDASLTRGWYKDQIVFYFNFLEKDIMTTSTDEVPVSPIFVSFNINPDETGGGPASGFVSEGGSAQTHNVVATLPSDAGYSPLWTVSAYDNAEFGLVNNLESASAATSKGSGLANVNCPIVSIEMANNTPVDPMDADKAMIDRFSADAGHLMVRDESNGLPEANAPIDFDSGEPFITQGLGPDGQTVQYYNFDVQPVEPAPIFVLFRSGESNPVDGQMNIVDDIPGDGDYNDFWQVVKVTVPENYVANTVTSYEEIMNKKFPMEETDMLVNCPIVPDGSTATKRLDGGETSLTMGWYRGDVIFYFNFSEKALTTTGSGQIPLSPIFVCFNINPGETDGGPASGFKMEDMSVQTHNVVATIPSDDTYSPLWEVSAYDNAEFDMVSDFSSASSATSVGSSLATVNCPIVSME